MQGYVVNADIFIRLTKISGKKKNEEYQMGLNYEVGDIVTLKKAHPCGSKEWEILPIGKEVFACLHGSAQENGKYSGWEQISG